MEKNNAETEKVLSQVKKRDGKGSGSTRALMGKRLTRKSAEQERFTDKETAT